MMEKTMSDNLLGDLIREELGKAVRSAWVAYCQETGDTKPSHLAPWEELSEWDKEADRRIGAAIAVMMAERLLPTSFAAIATTRLTRREEWPAQRLDDAARVTEEP
jgi:hypothetical protein